MSVPNIDRRPNRVDPYKGSEGDISQVGKGLRVTKDPGSVFVFVILEKVFVYLFVVVVFLLGRKYIYQVRNTSHTKYNFFYNIELRPRRLHLSL